MDHTTAGRHAFLVLAHEDPQMVRRLVARLAPLGPVYLHVDAKTDLTQWSLRDLPVELVLPRVSVYWGDWSGVDATVALMRAALADPQVSRLTFVSGLHYPIISDAELREKAATLCEVIGSRPAPNMPDGSRPEVDYLRRFFRTTRPNTRWSQVKNGVMNRIVYAGRPLDWRSVAPTCGMRAGEAYWSIRREFATYCVERIDSRSPLIDYFSKIVCADEKVFATLYGEFCGEIGLEGTTFSKWMTIPGRPGTFPAPVTRADIEEIRARDVFWFARKIHSTDVDTLDWLDSLA